MKSQTEEYLLIGAGALAIYFLFIKKPAGAVAVTSSSTGVTSIPNGTVNTLAANTGGLSSLATAVSNLFNKAPLPPAGGTQGSGAVQLISADPIPSQTALPTNAQLITQIDANNPFATPGALVVPGITSIAPVTVNNSVFDTPSFASVSPFSGGGSNDLLDDSLFGDFPAITGVM